MTRDALKVLLFTIGLVVLFVWAGEVITRASGGAEAAVLGEGVSVENGEQIFWGPGKCHTCHSAGTRGSNVRCPNLGASADGSEIGLRSVERARERSEELGQEMSPVEYLVESIVSPSAHVVEGYKDEMPKVYEPPISLGADEISSVILYLQALGGVPEPGRIVLPAEIRMAGLGGGSTEPWAPYLAGDTLRGSEIFFDVEGPAPCAKCHRVGDRGGDIGPELTGVAGTRPARFIVESVLQPSLEIASGYETVLIQLTDGRLLDGVVRSESADSLWLVTSDGEEVGLEPAEIARRREQELSLMPDNFSDVLTVTDLHDLLAYLFTLR
jgi:putative heme-binding domain-containing protein